MCPPFVVDMDAVEGNDKVCSITAFLTTAYAIFATNEPQLCCIRQGENLTLYNIHLRINRWAKKGVLERVFLRLQQLEIIQIRVNVISLDSSCIRKLYQ